MPPLGASRITEDRKSPSGRGTPERRTSADVVPWAAFPGQRKTPPTLKLIRRQHVEKRPPGITATQTEEGSGRNIIPETPISSRHRACRVRGRAPPMRELIERGEIYRPTTRRLSVRVRACCSQRAGRAAPAAVRAADSDGGTGDESAGARRCLTQAVLSALHAGSAWRHVLAVLMRRRAAGPRAGDDGGSVCGRRPRV